MVEIDKCIALLTKQLIECRFILNGACLKELFQCFQEITERSHHRPYDLIRQLDLLGFGHPARHSLTIRVIPADASAAFCDDLVFQDHIRDDFICRLFPPYPICFTRIESRLDTHEVLAAVCDLLCQSWQKSILIRCHVGEHPLPRLIRLAKKLQVIRHRWVIESCFSDGFRRFAGFFLRAIGDRAVSIQQI